MSPNVDIEPVILENISGRIPNHLKNSANQQTVLADLLAEVQEEYKTNIKTFTGSLVTISFTPTEMYAGRVACCPLVSHVKYAPRALL